MRRRKRQARRTRNPNRRYLLNGALILWAGAVTIAFLIQKPDEDAAKVGSEKSAPRAVAQSSDQSRPRFARENDDPPSDTARPRSGARDSVDASDTVAQVNQPQAGQATIARPQAQLPAQPAPGPRPQPESDRALLAQEETRSEAESEAGDAGSDSTAQATSDVAQLETATDAVNTSSPHLARAQFTTGIENREPVDRVESVFPTSGEALRTLYYFTEIRDMSGEIVVHRWELNDRVMAEVSFEIGGPRWRVYSSKDLTPAMTGQWQVSVVAADGEIIHTDSFVYGGP